MRFLRECPDTRSDGHSGIVPLSMDVVLAAVAALVAGGFSVRLFRSAAIRPRLHVRLWAIAMAMYAVATLLLTVGLAFGWTSLSFRLFYLLGAVANIPFLAAGSVALVLGEEIGKRFAAGVAGFCVAAAVAVFTAPLIAPIDTPGVPAGSELFEWTVAVGGFSLPGPRVFAVIAGSLGTIIVIALAAWSAIRWWGDQRRRSVANVFIVAGVVAPALGGSLTAFGEAGGLAVSLLVGAVLLYTGFVMASDATPR